MKNRWLGRALVGVGLSSTLVLAGCSAPSGSETGDGEPQAGGSLTVVSNSDVSSWDPAKCGTDQAGFIGCNAVYGSLIVYDYDKKEFVGSLAESFTSDDGKTWTLTLREGTEFSDGTPFDAAAVVYNWDRIADPTTASRALGQVRDLSWTAVDDATVQVVLPVVNYQFPWALTSSLAFIGSPTAMQEKGDDFFTQPVGAGPFVLDEWVQGASTALSKYDGYWDAPRPLLDTLNIKTIPQDDLRADALRSGEADIDIHFIDQINEELSADGYTALTNSMISGSGFTVNVGIGDTEDLDVRQALALAAGSDLIVGNLYPGSTVPKTLINESYGLDVDATFSDEDLTKAQKLIDRYLERTGKDKVEVLYSVGTWSPILKQLAELVQANLNRLDGVDVKLETVDQAAMTAKLTAKDVQLGHGALSGLNLDFLYDYFHTDGSQNVLNYSNPEVDAALDRTRSESDAATVQKAYEDAVTAITEDYVYLPYRGTNTYFAHNDKAHGLVQGGSFMSLEVDRLWTSGG